MELSGQVSAAIPVAIVIGLVWIDRVDGIRVNHSGRRRGRCIGVGSGSRDQDTPAQKPSGQRDQCKSHDVTSCRDRREYRRGVFVAKQLRGELA